jgi:hypothetical protein
LEDDEGYHALINIQEHHLRRRDALDEKDRKTHGRRKERCLQGDPHQHNKPYRSRTFNSPGLVYVNTQSRDDQGVFPFVGLQIIRLGLCIIFPKLITFYAVLDDQTGGVFSDDCEKRLKKSMCSD